MRKQSELPKLETPVRRMTAIVPNYGEVLITWIQKHGIWFLTEAFIDKRSMTRTLFKDVLTESTFRQFCKHTGTTYSWENRA
jgi:hypothetical protein